MHVLLSTDANRWPEKKFPGKFDYLGMTSHAIWHVFVCFGIYVSDSIFFLFIFFMQRIFECFEF